MFEVGDGGGKGDDSAFEVCSSSKARAGGDRAQMDRNSEVKRGEEMSQWGMLVERFLEGRVETKERGTG